MTKTRSKWQLVVVGILLLLTLQYVLWRSLFTLNLDTVVNGVFSLGLLLAEILRLAGSTIQLFFLSQIKDRSQEADWGELSVISGRFTPSVDILIPTYNEHPSILRRTIIGCQALDYTRKTIYLLDDTRRPEMKRLAAELGCEYITRPNNLNAKAGNLNNALPQTSGDLIAVFDADFIPTRNFLKRTVGFFKDKEVALVQTPQSYYNPDPVAYNLGLENILTAEEELFYRHIQPIRDSANSIVCCGTSFVVRRSALLSIGGFFTDSIAEDYYTGVCLSALGYKLIYLDEKLSAGLAAENIASHVSQRLRWAQGTLQGLFLEANPLRIPGLTNLQRLVHLDGLLYWFTSWSRIYFLIVPIAYAFFGIIPFKATATEVLCFLVPFYLLQFSVFSWINCRSRSAFMSDIYSVVSCFPIGLTVLQTMLNPFSRGFKVTPKGISRESFNYNWQLASPLIIVFVATAISFGFNLTELLIPASSLPSQETAQLTQGISLAWIWSGYNLLVLSIALLILLDSPNPNTDEWFDLRKVVRINIGGQTYWGITKWISQVGAQIKLTEKLSISLKDNIKVSLKIMGENLRLQGKITHTDLTSESPTFQIGFNQQMSLPQTRCLIEMLFCGVGQWKRCDTPGEFSLLWLLLKSLLQPRFVFNRNPNLSTISSAEVPSSTLTKLNDGIAVVAPAPKAMATVADFQEDNSSQPLLTPISLVAQPRVKAPSVPQRVGEEVAIKVAIPMNPELNSQVEASAHWEAEGETVVIKVAIPNEIIQK
ncbi:glycosyltransferase [Moorena sp. SIO3I8]|uniref:glycosyltransferase n=1 Tax=Moorena sp. SIO3I8 TaxID=2607833 RepID=UPI0013C08269|nr:glycosyltransferase [Moorena sp. SIO3I8]NEO08305.1 glycosyltransferase [Moorena sp. SIO3I8]